MSKQVVQSLDLNQARQDFERLYERATGNLERINIARDGEAGCVLISREELDALEHAIEILSDSQDVRELAHSLAKVAHASAAMAGNSLSV